MLTNPYPTKLDSADGTGIKLQCDIHPADKALIMSIRPSKGTTQLVVNNLIKNLCDDLRELNITGWQLDGDTILTILTERREFSESQIERLRHTSICATGTVPARLLDNRRGTSVRKKASKPTSQSTNPKKRVAGRVERTGETIPSETTAQSEQNPTES